MKNILFSVFMILISLSCNKEAKENIIWEIPENLPNQNLLDVYNLRSKIWKTSEIIGQDSNKPQEIILHKSQPENNFYSFGNIIKFSKNNTFDNFYTADCGNDCFPSSSGEYFFSDEKHIFIKIKKFEQTGMCTEKKIALKEPFLKYLIHKDENNLKFIKSND